MATNYCESPIEAPQGERCDSCSSDDQFMAFKITDYYDPLSPGGPGVAVSVSAVIDCPNDQTPDYYDNDNFYRDQNDSQMRTYINLDDNPCPESDNMCSQPIPNQQMFPELDNILQNLPKSLYTDKLRVHCKDCEDTIAMYRSILAKRARTKTNCPTGSLIMRKTTKYATSSMRYAADCYNIQQFIDNGDPKDVTDIFTKKRATIKMEPNEEPDHIGFDTICVEVILYSVF